MIEAQVNSLPINVVDFVGRIYTHERDKVFDIHKHCFDNH